MDYVAARVPLIAGWVGGREAAALLQNDEGFIVNQAIDSLAHLLRIPETRVRAELVAAHFHDWRADPFARGAYSYLPVGGREAQQVLSEPINNLLYFAGEALAGGHVGTVHGAMMSGIRAARAILQEKNL